MSATTPLSTPARLTAISTPKLPRLPLVLLAVLYILVGLFWRDPWKNDDVIGLATMLTALEPDASVLHTQVGNLAYAQNGPLVTWVGMLCITLFSPLFSLFFTPLDAAIIASRLPNLLWFGATAAAVWQGVYLLGRRPEPQPLPLPFGGEPSAQSYGRLLADAALLLLFATFGIVWRMHETSFLPALIALHALAFYAVVRMLDRPAHGAVVLGLALGGVFLTRGWVGVLPVLLTGLALCLPGTPLQTKRRWLWLAVAIAAVLMLVWWFPAQQANPYWMQQWAQWHRNAFGWPRWSMLSSLVRDYPWFLWPTWPFALLALWQWRRWLRAPHIAVPLAFLLGSLLFYLFLVQASEPEYSLLAIPCAVLAAFSLPTLRRGLVNSLDWFSVMCFSLGMTTVWLGWFAQQTGWPRQIARNIALQTAGFEVLVVWPAVILALLGTVAWGGLVYWRLARKPVALWRGTALCAGGAVGTWLLLGTLWMPSLDYARSYRQVSAQLSAALQQHVQPGECVRTHRLGLGQRASFFVFDRLTFAFAPHCTLVLHQTSPRIPYAAPDNVEVLWEGKRAPDRHEMFRLLRVNPITFY